MKIDLNRLSSRLCNTGVILMLIDIIHPNFPLPLGDIGFVAAICGLLTLLADEIIERKRRAV